MQCKSSCLSTFQLTPPIQRATGRYAKTQCSYIFQLTPPIQRATRKRSRMRGYQPFQLTPPIQRATDTTLDHIAFLIISTHAPYTEGDDDLPTTIHKVKYFNSRPLYRGRHDFLWDVNELKGISTHAPYTEGDITKYEQGKVTVISTHAPYTEGDDDFRDGKVKILTFQLTPPIQRATAKNRQYSPIFRIIINNYNPCNRRLRNIL